MLPPDPSPTFLQVDAEGADFDIVSAAVAVRGLLKPRVILYEHHALTEAKVAVLAGLLAEAGYDCNETSSSDSACFLFGVKYQMDAQMGRGAFGRAETGVVGIGT